MEIVIKIHEEVYKRVVVSPRCTPVLDAFEDRDLFVKSLQNGTPLPKGHGRIGDLDAFIDAYGYCFLNDVLESEKHLRTQILVEADKEDNDGDSN